MSDQVCGTLLLLTGAEDALVGTTGCARALPAVPAVAAVAANAARALAALSDGKWVCAECIDAPSSELISSDGGPRPLRKRLKIDQPKVLLELRFFFFFAGLIGFESLC